MDTQVVIIGGSAGSIEVMVPLLKALEPSSACLLFVVHLPTDRDSQLVPLLGRLGPWSVAEATDGAPIRPGWVYVIQSNHTLELHDGALRARALDGRGARSIDIAFSSVASAQKDQTIAVLLSGASADGTHGLRDVRTVGGVVIVQDPASAEQPVMPESAVRAGLASRIVAPDQLAEAIQEELRSLDGGKQDPDETVLRTVVDTISRATGLDLPSYKMATIQRSLDRVVRQKGLDLPALSRHLADDRVAAERIGAQMLIGVTGFFRDPQVFACLEAEAIPRLLADTAPDQPLRIWVPACSTGEEAYSFAMAFAEPLGERLPQLQIFATDVNPRALAFAREGSYSERSTADIPAERRARWMICGSDGRWRFRQELRNRVLFARQDILSDPPFSNIDLVSCRNLLIYLLPSAQQRVFRVAHYALRPGGVLMLGRSEHLGESSELFERIAPNMPLFRRQETLTQPHAPAMLWSRLPPRPGRQPWRAPQTAARDVRREADRLMLRRYSPPAILVDSALNIVEFRNRTSRYLEPTPGAASLHLLRMLREGLQPTLREQLALARATQQPQRRERVRFLGEAGPESCSVEVLPIRSTRQEPTAFLILFEPTDLPAVPCGEAEPRRADEAAQLREELELTRRHMQAIIEEQKGSVEDLQTAYEELQSSNEELQTSNEELETAKEELQSGYEELTAVNDQLESRNILLATRERQLRFSEQRYRGLFENAPIGLSEIDPEGRYVAVNHSLAHMLGYQPHELIGRAAIDLVHPDQQAESARNLPALLDGSGQNTVERCMRCKDGAGLWVRSVAQTVELPNGQTHLFAITRDISAERALRLQQRDAAQKARALNETLRAQLLETSNLAALGTLAAGIAHELNQPLTAIELTASLLENTDTTDARIRDEMSRILTACRHMARIVSNVRSFGRKEPFQRRPVRAHQPIDDALVLMNAQLKMHQITIEREISSDYTISADRTRLQQVFVNLIANAMDILRGAPLPRRVRLSIVGAPGALVFAVEDNGPGVPEDIRDEIFSPFFSQRASGNGMGLGLALCRTIISEHRGTIGCAESSLGGARFTITLPREETA